MKTCKHCGAQLNDDERFCYQCGTSVFGQDNETATVKKQKKLWPFILVFAVILLVLIGQLVYKFVSGSTEKKYNNQLALAERYLDELDYDKAIAAYKAAIEIDPIQAEAYLGLAEVYLEEGNIQAAIDILKDGYEITGTSKLKKRLSELEEQLARMNEAESSAREEENEESQDNDNPSQENEARFTLWNGKVNWRGGKWTNRNDILPHISEDGYIIFGAYEQDGDVSNGPEPIEWEIIEDEEKRVLLASRYILDEQAYNIENDVAKWENCSLRKWLNEDFLTTAFTSKEQKWIDFTILKNPDNPVLLNYGGEIAEGGNDTRDQIFCLEVD